jgi:hypothetical protein
MQQVTHISSRRGSKGNRRRKVVVELPEFAIEALAYQAELANAEGGGEGDGGGDAVTFNDVIEWYVVSPLSVKELPHLEAAVPGFTAAFTKWLFAAMYTPPES